MKYIVLLCDGMADYPLEELGGKTPMSAAVKPNMDYCAAHGEVGLVKTVPDEFSPGSDVANLAVMGYDPALYYSGRSPLEAASIGIPLSVKDVATRCNLVTLSDEDSYADKTLIDYCADDISTAEADELVKYLHKNLGTDTFEFHTGVSYRHCLVWRNAEDTCMEATPPHDITGKPIANFLPKCTPFLSLMQQSYDLLKNHPINLNRIEKGLRPANSIWLWGSGSKKELPSFKEKYGVNGSVISAVDLIKGIGKLTDMNVISVEGATGYIDTNFDGKAQATLETLKNGADFVYVHVEAPDECGHRFEIDNKVKSIELIDSKILGFLLKELNCFDDYKLMILPDHATPLSTRTHARNPVPYIIYHKNSQVDSNITTVNEETAASTGIYIEPGYTIMSHFICD